jgi:hypothetical protein
VSSGRNLKLTAALILAPRPPKSGFLPVSIFLHLHSVVIKCRVNCSVLADFLLCFCSDLKMEAVCTSETFMNFYWATSW